MNEAPPITTGEDVEGPAGDPGRRPRWWLRALVASATVFVVFAAVVVVWVYREVNPPGHPGASVAIDIPSGATTSDIASLLAKRGVIGSARVFRVYVRIDGAGPWQAGRYVIPVRSSMRDVVKALDAGPVQDFGRITIPEGYTLLEIAGVVGGLPGMTSEQFLAASRDGSVRSIFEPTGSNNLEGLLFPDTYVVGDKTTASDLLKRMVTAFEDRATQVGLVAGARALGITPYDVVVVASMIEREAKVPEDRGKIARVIYNRLAQGMPLGIDATIRYGVNKPSGPLLQSDLTKDSPYNTRTRKGLPPTPIASPGVASLDAALHPTPGPWLYYVIADSDGRHTFVVTPQEFEQATAEAERKGLL